MTAAYTTGTITLTNGSAAIIGTGTGWATAVIAGGVIYPAASGNALPIAEIVDDTHITAAVPWAGATGTYSYALMRDTAFAAQTVANAQALAAYLARLDNPVLSAMAASSGGIGADTLLYFASDTTAAVTALTAWARGLLAADGASEGIAALGAPEFGLSLLLAASAPDFWNAVGATSGPQQAFRRGNILGSVAQSAGVPTGAVIERGSNANGEYVRFADGTQICTAVGADQDNATAVGGVARTAAAATWTYPAAFVAAPSGNCAPRSSTRWGGMITNLTSASYLQFGATTSATALSSNLLAIGRWF